MSAMQGACERLLAGDAYGYSRQVFRPEAMKLYDISETIAKGCISLAQCLRLCRSLKGLVRL